jgi:hypothetical protein
VRLVALELCDGDGRGVSIARRFEGLTSVAVRRVDAEVEVRFGGYLRECSLRDGRVWVDSRCSGGGR